jgi:hypothetical protein
MPFVVVAKGKDCEVLDIMESFATGEPPKMRFEFGLGQDRREIADARGAMLMYIFWTRNQRRSISSPFLADLINPIEIGMGSWPYVKAPGTIRYQ